jgi:hypothetical protein
MSGTLVKSNAAVVACLQLLHFAQKFTFLCEFLEPSPSFLGARSFIIIFCIARRWVLSYDSYIRTLTAQLFKFCVVTVPSTSVFPSSLFPLRFQTNVHICLSSPCVLGLPAPPTLAFITLVIHNEEYKL